MFDMICIMCLVRKVVRGFEWMKNAVGGCSDVPHRHSRGTVRRCVEIMCM